jgi:hypothetical protein
MATNSEIPTQGGRPFSERIPILGVTYTLNFWWNAVTQCWDLDIYDEAGATEILVGVPLVTGCDLLEQFGYMPFGAQTILTAMTFGPGLPPDAVPTFTNLGIDSHLYTTSP